MADPRDDRVGAAYREMGSDAPPPALDAAIQAAARRAVGARPGGTRRWQLPISIAAVLALAIGVSLQVEREKPMVVDGTPVSSGSAEYPVALPATEAEERQTTGKPVAAPATPAATPPATPAATPEGSPAAAPAMREQSIVAPAPRPSKPDAPAPKGMEPPPALARQPVPAPEAKRFAPDPPRAEPLARPSAPPAAAPPQASGAAPFSAPQDKNVVRMPAAADAVRPAEPARAAAPPAPRAKSELSRDESTREERATPGAAETPEKQLERIALLRNRGMHEDADRALAQFRRDHPGYRISEEWLRKVGR